MSVCPRCECESDENGVCGCDATGWYPCEYCGAEVAEGTRCACRNVGTEELRRMLEAIEDGRIRRDPLKHFGPYQEDFTPEAWAKMQSTQNVVGSIKK